MAGETKVRKRCIGFDQVKKPVPTPHPPVLDRLSFTVDIPSGVARPSSTGVAEWREGRHSLDRVVAGRGTRYKHSFRLKRDPRVHIAHIAFDPVKTGNAFLRVDLNPARLPRLDLTALRTFLRFLFVERHDEIMARAKVTRLDIALDVDNVLIENLMVYTKSGVQSAVWGKEFARNGATRTFHIQTKALGAINSDQRFRAYDRSVKMAETGEEVLEHDRARIEVQVTPRVRIGKKSSEGSIAARRAKSGPPIRVGAYLNELRQLPNPFASLTIAEAPSNTRGDLLFKLFLDACRLRGEEAALKLITDPGRQREYRIRLSRRSPDWWDPIACWKSLERLVRESGLFPLGGFGD